MNSNDGKNLFFCRTPLQSLIINRILHECSGEPLVVYYPTSSSKKHEYYFDKIETSQKYFLPWKQIQHSDTLTALLAWWRIPKWIRRQKYRHLFISSIGDISFSVMAGVNSGAKIYSFDDGTFNLNKEVYLEVVNCEPMVRRVVKFLLGGISNPELIKRLNCHFTIYPREFVVGVDCKIREIKIFRQLLKQVETPVRSNVTVLLGSWFVDPICQLRYEKIVVSKKIDMFIPHPAESASTRVEHWLTKYLGHDYEDMIAEDLVKVLIEKGFLPTVYGFGSSALVNLANTVPTINIRIDPNRTELYEVTRKLNVQQIGFDEF